MANFFIICGPTLLFILMLISGFLIGMIRGFRKSLILFFHMLGAFTICLIIYLILVNNDSIDYSLVSFMNNWITKFSENTLQGLLNVDEGVSSLREILLQKVISTMSEEDLMYYLVVDNAAYIYAIVEMIYRVILFILVAMLYLDIIFILYIIYFFAYPVRRRARKVNHQFQKGEISHPYRHKRLLGGAVGVGRALIVGVFSFSFLGAMLFIVTGGKSMPSRQEAREEEVDFNNEAFNTAYDYYSVVCEMADSGIFKVLNGIKDPSKTPFYFYMSDLVLQGRISDPTLEVEDKFYLRDETGAYVGFVKDVFQLMVKYSTNEELQTLLSDSNTDDKMTSLTSIMSKEGFKEEFNQVVDQFEEKPFMKYLILSSLTSLINHIDLATNNDPTIVNLVNTIFKGEDALKVTDLMNFNDAKLLFKGLVDVIATSSSSEVVKLSAEEEVAPKANETKKYILYARKFLPYIQDLTIFQDDSQSSKGNILIRKLYLFSAENFVTEDVTLPTIPEDLSWMKEFNILFDVADPLLGISYNVFDPDNNQMIHNLLDMFHGDNASENEAYYDELTSKISDSSLLDVVFKSTMVGNTITQTIQNMTANEEAGMPMSDISFSGENGECVVLLSSFKHLIKNDGKKLYEALTDDSELKGNAIKSAFEILNSEVRLSDTENSTLIDVMMESKVLHYMLSSIFVYGKYGTFEFYIPDSVSDIKQEGSGEEAKTYRIVKLEEISKIVHTLSKCAGDLVSFIDEPENADYASLFKNDILIDGIEKSIILKGTIANLFINSTENQEVLVLPKDYDNPAKWIETKEIDNLIDAVVSLSEQTTEDGENLINQLLSGSIKAKELLQLRENTISKLFTSTVLRYTISDSITSLGTNDFEIVVPRRDIEILNAETTTDKLVDVVKQDSLTKIFTDIDMIISFDDNDQISLNPTNIFNHKAELVQNDVLHATIINYLIKMSTDSENSIIVPQNYQTDFEKFRTEIELNDNLWFGSTSAADDDELYKVLDFIESCIADETGAIPADFSFENDLSNQIKIRKNDNSLNEISSSALLNATLSHHIIINLATPVSLYHDELIEANELNSLLDCTFLILGKDELTVTDLSNFEETSLILKESMISELIKSEIICATMSDYITTSESIVVPKASTEPIELVNKEASNMIHHSDIDPELYNMLCALMSVFGEQKEGETEKSLDIKNVSTDHLILTVEDKEEIKKSLVLQATLSKYIIEKSSQGIIIPKDDLILTKIAVVNYEEEQTIIQTVELDCFLDSAFALFAEDGKLNINQIKVDNIYIQKTDITEITKSVIMNTTMLDQMIGIDENMIVPIIENEIDGFERLNYMDQQCYKVTSSEMSYLLSALIDMIGTNDQIKTTEIQISNIRINSNIDVTKSHILAATIGNKLMNINVFTIPNKEVYSQAIAQKDAASINKDLILTDELKKLTDSLFSMIDDIQINNGASNIDINTLTLSTSNLNTILASSIMAATMSDKLFTDSVIIPNKTSVVETILIYGKTDAEISILATELENLFKGVFAMLGKNEIQILKLQEADTFKTIKKGEGVINAIFASEILMGTISDAICNVDIIKKRSVDIYEADVYHASKSNTTVAILKPEETLLFFSRLSATTEGDEICLIDFTLDKILLPNTLEDCKSFVQSGCIMATMSSQVMGIDSSHIVVLDECKEIVTSEEIYIEQTELAKLIYALKVGLNYHNVNEVKSFSTIAVPKSDETEKIEALTGSDIIRATISKIVLNDNEAVQVASNEVEIKRYGGNEVVLFTATEIKQMILGINMLSMSGFDHVQLDLTVILTMPTEQKIQTLEMIAQSTVFKTMISIQLNETILGLPRYQLLTSETQTIKLSTGIYTYIGPNASGKYILQAPTSGTIYTGFSATTLVNQDLFSADDILALQGVTISY